jgi:hypothetical protein
MLRPSPNPAAKRTNTGRAHLLASLASGAPLFAAYLLRQASNSPVSKPMQRFFRLPIILAFAWLTSYAASAQDLLVKRTGIALPAEILGFARGTETDLEAQAAGYGTAISFGMPGKFTATLFAYTANLDPLPQSIRDSSAALERERAVQDVLVLAKSMEPKNISANARRTLSNLINTKSNPGTSVSYDSFIVYTDGRATNSFLFMWVAKSHLWKLRITRAPGPIAETPIAFALSLIDTTLK